MEAYFKELKKQGLSPEREWLIREELAGAAVHDPAAPPQFQDDPTAPGPYAFHDPFVLQAMATTYGAYHTYIRSVDELLERDKQREKDGFPRKIRVGRLVKPGREGTDKIVVVPTTVEEKFIHDPRFKETQEDQTGGAGDGGEGEVIGEQPVREESGGEGAGEGQSGAHEIESTAYDLGKILTDKFELPNLEDKGKKRSLTHYTYDMTDRHRGFGQLLDKKATMRRIIETNIALGNLPDVSDIDASRFIVAPDDMVYRILSKEIDYESQAIVFFLRDYSGSMSGKPTELVVSQHLLIYSWLFYQYARHVEARFILHDTEAKEVDDFYTYYNSKVAGGTKVASAFKLVNKIIQEESLVKDYNIYVFHGTDGDDWDTNGKETIPEIKQMLTYAARVGITIAERSYGSPRTTEVEKYLKNSKLLEEQKKQIRMDIIREDADEARLIQGIKKLIS